MSSITYIASEALDIQSGLPFASKEEKGRIDKVLKTWNTYYLARQTQFSSTKQISVLVKWDWHAMWVDLDSWPERCLQRDQRRCWRKHQNSSTSERVTQQRARETRPRIDLTFYWCSMVNQWHSRWQRGSILWSRSNFSSRSLAWSITTNMCLLRKTFCGLIKKPWSSLCRSP